MPNWEQEGEKEGQERQMGQRIGGDTRKGREGEGRKLTKLKGIFSKQDHRNVIDRPKKSWTVLASILLLAHFPCSFLKTAWCTAENFCPCRFQYVNIESTPTKYAPTYSLLN